MIPRKDLVLMSYLRQNARLPLTELSRHTGIPVSTIFDRLRFNEKGFISRHIALLNFNRLGFVTRANVLLRVVKHDKEKLLEHLHKNWNVNSLYKVNNGYDVLAECVFRNIKELESFVENLESSFAIKAKDIHYIVEDLKREAFLADPDIIDMLIREE